MVCRICELEFDDNNLFTMLVGIATYEKCVEVQPAVFERYREYNRLHGNPELVSTSTAFNDYKSVMHQMYESRKKQVVDFKNRIKGITASYCPLCGLPNEPSTVEHYLPKEDYPEFSIFSKNLVPACSPCNTHKGRALLDPQGHRRSLHVYFDDLCSRPIIELNLKQPYELGAGSIVASSSLTAIESQIVRNHLELYKINERYSAFFPAHFFDFWSEIHGMAEFDRALLEDYYQRRLDTKINRFGQNYWEVLLYRKALNSDLFDYMRENGAP